MKYLILFLLLFYSCSSDFKKSYKIGDIKLYELQCSRHYYLSTDYCDCKHLPTNYFIPKGENDSFFKLFLKENFKLIHFIMNLKLMQISKRK